jgi:hypothetical protein
LAARVLWTDPEWDLALLRAEGARDLASLPIASESDLATLSEVVALGFPLGESLAVEKGFPAVNVTKGKLVKTQAKNGRPSELEAELSVSPGNSGGPVLDKRGLVVGVIYARRENLATGKGISLAVPVNRLEWFLSRPQITVSPRIVTHGAGASPVKFEARLNSLFPPRDPIEIEMTLASPSGETHTLPTSRTGASYAVTAVPFSDAKPPSRVRVTLVSAPGPVTCRVKDAILKRTSREFTSLTQVRRIRLQPAVELEGHFRSHANMGFAPPDSSRIAGPVTGLDAVLASVEEQLPNFDPAEVDEIEVTPVSLELAFAGPHGPATCLVEDRWLRCADKKLRLADVRRLRLKPAVEIDAILYLTPNDRPFNGSAATLKGPVVGVEKLVADVARQVPTFDVNQVDEIQVKPVTVECLLTLWPSGTAVANAECDDRELKVGAETIRLSGCRRVRMGKFPMVELAHRERIEAPIAGLDGLLREIKRRTPSVDLKTVSRIVVDPIHAAPIDGDVARCTIVAKRAGTIVGRLETEIYRQAREQPNLETLSRGKFLRPHRSVTPVTLMRLRVPEGDGFAQCHRDEQVDEFRRCLIRSPADAAARKQTFLLEGDRFLAASIASDGQASLPVGLTPGSLVIAHNASAWRVECRLPTGERFQPGEYLIVANDPEGTPRNPIATGRSYLKPGDDPIPYEGRIRIWEFDADRRAFDFILRKKTDKPSAGAGSLYDLVGMYRWRSTFE